VPEIEPEPIAAVSLRQETPPPKVAVEEVESAPVGDSSITLAQAQQNWARVLMHVQKVLKQPQVAAMARGGKPVDITGSVLTVGFVKSYEMHRQVTQNNAAFITKALEDVMRVKLKVSTTTIADDSAGEARAGASSREVEKSEPVQHPLTNDILTMFDGRIVDADQDPWEDSSNG